MSIENIIFCFVIIICILKSTHLKRKLLRSKNPSDLKLFPIIPMQIATVYSLQQGHNSHFTPNPPTLTSFPFPNATLTRNNALVQCNNFKLLELKTSTLLVNAVSPIVSLRTMIP